MFAGALSFGGPDAPWPGVGAGVWERALAPYRAPDLEGAWRDGPALLVQQRLFNGPATKDERVPLVCPETGVGFAFWGRLDEREALAAALGIGSRELAATTDAALALAAWRRWGRELPARLTGDFAVAVLDPSRGEAFLARDAFGTKPLFYLLDRRGLVFATTVAALRSLPEPRLTPDPEWMARYLLMLSMSDRRTAYREVVKVPPGHWVTIGRDGRERVTRWHHWRDDPPRASRRDERWVTAYRAVLAEAVRCRMQGEAPFGTENSGGLDSATVTTYLARFLDDPGGSLWSFGYAVYQHEPARILETSQAGGISRNYVVTTIDPGRQAARAERILRVLGHPEEHPNGSFHMPFYRECEVHGMRTLFSGFGGDEVATNPAVHVRRELVDAGDPVALWDVLPGTAATRALRLAKAVTVGRGTQAYDARFVEAMTGRWPHELVSAGAVAAYDLHRRYLDAARYGAPYRRVNDFILQHLLRAPYIATRLEVCTLMAASYGVDYRWPLLDPRLVQQYLSTPAVEKLGPRGMGRYLHRRAVAGVVPPSIAWKAGKGMGAAAPGRTPLGRLDAAVQRARELEAELHPALHDLVDRRRLRDEIARAERPGNDDQSAFAFGRRVDSLAQLDGWLRS